MTESEMMDKMNEDAEQYTIDKMDEIDNLFNGYGNAIFDGYDSSQLTVFVHKGLLNITKKYLLEFIENNEEWYVSKENFNRFKKLKTKKEIFYTVGKEYADF